MDEEAVRLYTDLGAGFKYLDIMQQVCPGFLEVLEMMCEVTTALDQYSRNATGAPDIADLLKARNTVQHALLSAASRGSGSDSRRTIYEKLCRLAALIFSDMVIFPIPPAQGLKSRLAKMLQSTLERVDQEPATSIHSRLLVWITMMGAIASASTAYHCWYLQRLHSQLLQLKLTSWRDLRELCAKHLWWSPVCDVPGRSIFDIVSILGKE